MDSSNQIRFYNQALWSHVRLAKETEFSSANFVVSANRIFGRWLAALAAGGISSTVLTLLTNNVNADSRIRHFVHSIQYILFLRISTFSWVYYFFLDSSPEYSISRPIRCIVLRTEDLSYPKNVSLEKPEETDTLKDFGGLPVNRRSCQEDLLLTQSGCWAITWLITRAERHL